MNLKVSFKVLQFSEMIVKYALAALAGWLRWLEQHPVHQKVGGSNPSQGTDVGCMFCPWPGHIEEAIDQ